MRHHALAPNGGNDVPMITRAHTRLHPPQSLPLLFTLASCACLAPAALAQPKPAPPSSPKPPASVNPAAPATHVEQSVRDELDNLRARLATEPPATARALRADIEKLFDLYLAYGASDQDATLLVDLATTRRLARQFADPKNTSAAKLAPLLAANPELAATLALAIRPEDDVAAVYAVLEKLNEKFPQDLTDRAGASALAAAVCVVYDQPPAHPTLGKGGVPPTGASPVDVDPVEVFGYFRANESRMLLRGLNAPVEVLIHLVDVHAPIDELRWALKNYGNDATVGKVYGTIVYDTAALKFSQPKKVFKDGYSLMNIKKVGGVCAEQAYFASEVAKAIGVPSVYVTGEGADVGHAWVGYMKSAGGKAQVWDFTEGRFGDYKTTQGRVTDPQTNKPTTDAMVGLSALALSAGRVNVRAAAARTDAATRLVELDKPGAWPPAWPAGESWGEVPKAPARSAGISGGLAMLRAALTSCPGYEPAWMRFSAWAEKGLLDAPAKKEWGEVVMKMAGRDRPDFAFAMLAPMIRSAKTAPEQSVLWDWAATEFHHRPDLVSAARLSQGQCWEKAGDSGKAWDAYKDVITKYPNEGRSVLYALGASEKLLRSTNKEANILPLYEDAFRRITRPGQLSPGFETASNYYQAGFRYAQLLETAGRDADAKRIRKQIGVPETPAKPAGG